LAAVNQESFDRVVAEGLAMQARLAWLEPVAVGGTAAAVHCGHRFSLDVDCVTPGLSAEFDRSVEVLEHWEGWKTNRCLKPLMILGQRHAVQLGVRQMRRGVPLQVTERQGLRVPTAREMLRVKAFLSTERRAVRDFVDVAALAVHLGDAAALESLRYLNLTYAASGEQSALTRFAEACELEPLDLHAVPLAHYKGLRTPFTDWAFVRTTCQNLARRLLKLELVGELPAVLDAGFHEPDSTP
jgi:hypothetical protein